MKKIIYSLCLAGFLLGGSSEVSAFKAHGEIFCAEGYPRCYTIWPSTRTCYMVRVGTDEISCAPSLVTTTGQHPETNLSHVIPLTCSNKWNIGLCYYRDSFRDGEGAKMFGDRPPIPTP